MRNFKENFNIPTEIAMEALQMNLTEIYHLRNFTDEQRKILDLASWAYKNRIPNSRIFGRKFFWKDVFKVSPFTLEPRRETEILVEYVVERLRPNSILDLGTGSGCILLSLLREFPDSYGLGVDISPYAIETAKINSSNLNIKANFILEDFVNVNGEFDLVISNPPYVSTECEFEAMFDPPISLFDKNSYEKIIKTRNLSKNASIVLEVPEYSWNKVEELATKNGFKFIKEDISNKIAIYQLSIC